MGSGVLQAGEVPWVLGVLRAGEVPWVLGVLRAGEVPWVLECCKPGRFHGFWVCCKPGRFRAFWGCSMLGTASGRRGALHGHSIGIPRSPGIADGHHWMPIGEGLLSIFREVPLQGTPAPRSLLKAFCDRIRQLSAGRARGDCRQKNGICPGAAARLQLPSRVNGKGVDKEDVMKKRFVVGIAFSLLLAVGLLLAGCGNSDESGRQNYGGQEQDMEGEAGEGGQGEQGESRGQDAGQEDGASVQVEFEGKDMEGNEVSSSIFAQSKLTMVNVWATYCNPCLSEMPDLGELAGEYDSEEFQLIGIVGDVMEGGDQEDIDLAAELIELTGADYPHLLVNESLYFAFMTELKGVPTTFFVNEKGEIVDTVSGAKEKEVWKEKIDGLLEDL